MMKEFFSWNLDICINEIQSHSKLEMVASVTDNMTTAFCHCRPAEMILAAADHQTNMRTELNCQLQFNSFWMDLLKLISHFSNTGINFDNSILNFYSLSVPFSWIKKMSLVIKFKYVLWGEILPTLEKLKDRPLSLFNYFCKL